MKKNKWLIMLTCVSAVLFVALIMSTSLSPLAQFGKHANQFGSIGMWSSIGMIFVLYFIPLCIYVAGIDPIKYVMAIFCMLGIIITIAYALIALFLGILFLQGIQNLFIVIIIDLFLLIVNIIWLISMFLSMKVKKTN
ncbi:DUF5391 family protein [Pseudogracilibacillus auburnensis]|uniref:DUF5391 family protein n=1 Tax=Pseudogracilibacillus auburnensis TaxID=1494959 RepID=A0A2V3VWA5_9BACI|nr:DUF5391 family protein [Pseudogracilibacillus auburnensis]PXW85028.1 hypothetical protein DFR56_1125 [Pseudogracilibacillus auburnensis]